MSSGHSRDGNAGVDSDALIVPSNSAEAAVEFRIGGCDMGDKARREARSDTELLRINVPGST